MKKQKTKKKLQPRKPAKNIEYEKFRNLINIGVVLAFLLVFLVVELKNIQQKTIMSQFIATIVLSSLILLIGILTVIPKFKNQFGKTLMVFSIIIAIGVIIQMKYGIISLFMIIEGLLALTAFLYGRELILNRQIPIIRGTVASGSYR